MDNITDQIRGLAIGAHIGGVEDPARQMNPSLTEAINRVYEAGTYVSQRGQEIDPSAKTLDTIDSTNLRLLRRDAQTLAKSANDLVNAAERAIVKCVIARGDAQGGHTPALLRHFDDEIIAIARRVLESESSDATCLMWKIAEECYNEAAKYSGKLHADHYFVPLEETYLQSPYDPDFESEEYYEHENRLEIDEGYAKMWRRNEELREEASTQKRRDWPEFWARILSRCPGGATLFRPSAVRKPLRRPFPESPRYLFRAFDASTSGLSNEKIVASSMSLEPENAAYPDILQTDDRKASAMLYNHLTKSLFGPAVEDNLMSWSSSLLFVIQYAIWRSSKGGRHPSDIRICTVDTTKFPAEQFARDMWLLNIYQEMELREDQKRFFQFRLMDERYDNGEYLSQGLVSHDGRSCTFSLQDLGDAGLYNLYPHLKDPHGMKDWAKRVLDLRTAWGIPQATSREEISHAFRIAKSCFGRFDRADMAILLLAFQDRTYKVTGKRSAQLGRAHPEPANSPWAGERRGPVETARYAELKAMVDHCRQKESLQSLGRIESLVDPSGPWLLEEVLEVSAS